MKQKSRLHNISINYNYEYIVGHNNPLPGIIWTVDVTHFHKKNKSSPYLIYIKILLTLKI